MRKVIYRNVQVIEKLRRDIEGMHRVGVRDPGPPGPERDSLVDSATAVLLERPLGTELHVEGLGGPVIMNNLILEMLAEEEDAEWLAISVRPLLAGIRVRKTIAVPHLSEPLLAAIVPQGSEHRVVRRWRRYADDRDEAPDRNCFMEIIDALGPLASQSWAPGDALRTASWGVFWLSDGVPQRLLDFRLEFEQVWGSAWDYLDAECPWCGSRPGQRVWDVRQECELLCPTCWWRWNGEAVFGRPLRC